MYVGMQPEGLSVTCPYRLDSRWMRKMENYQVKRCCLARCHLQLVAVQQPGGTGSGHATSQIQLLEWNPLEPNGDGACFSAIGRQHNVSCGTIRHTSRMTPSSSATRLRRRELSSCTSCRCEGSSTSYTQRPVYRRPDIRK